MDNTNHYVTISSGASTNLFSDNKAARFRTKLCETIALKPVSTHWEVAVTLAHVPANYLNINDYCRDIVIKKSKLKRSEIIEKYTVPRYVFNEYTVPHDIQNFSAFDFVRHMNNSMTITDHKHFKLELSTIGAEKKKYSSSAPVSHSDDSTPVFVFRIGKDSKLILNGDGMSFWTQQLKLSPVLIGHDIVSSFTVPITEELNTKFLRLLYPLSFKVVSRDGNTDNTDSIPKVFPEDTVTAIQINKGSFKNERLLLQEIKSSIDAVIIEKNEDQSRKEVFRFTINNENTLTIEILDTKYAILFPDDLAFAFGFKKNTWYDSSSNKGLLPIDLHYNLNTIYVYSDIVTSSIVSNVKAPLLTILPVKQRSQDRIVPHYFPRLFYYPVNKTSISEISISMSGDYGKEIPFAENVETTMKLHFRVYKE